MKISNITAGLTVATLALALASRAGDTPTANPFLAVLSTAAQAELPAKAADLVGQAAPKQQPQTTINVVKAAVGLNPASAAVIVGSIAQTTPAMAPVAAGTAASLVPNQAATIARAAAAAAPQQAGKIVEAICRICPANYSEVAEAVAEVVPGAGKEILTGVGTAIPALQAPINQVLASQNGSIPSVNGVLDQVKNDTMLASISSARTVTLDSSMQPIVLTPPASVKPPYVAPPSNPINLNPGNGGTVPPGGREYANP